MSPHRTTSDSQEQLALKNQMMLHCLKMVLTVQVTEQRADPLVYKMRA